MCHPPHAAVPAGNRRTDLHRGRCDRHLAGRERSEAEEADAPSGPSCSSQNAPYRPQPTARALTGSPKTFSDPAAAVYGSEGWDSSPSERANVATGQSLAAWNRRGADSLSGGLISRNFSQP